MAKTKANRRKTVRAKKLRAQEQARYRSTPTIYGIAWACDDPACLEGIHHLDPSVVGDSSHNVERPSPASKGRSATHPKYEFGGATGGNGTQP